MVQNTVISFVDDIDGTDLADAENPTLTFGLDGTTYEIDLSEKNQDALRESLAPYIEVGRRVTGGRGRSAGRPSKAAETSGASAADVRAWAVGQGLDVPSRGRIPQEVRDAFDAAN